MVFLIVLPHDIIKKLARSCRVRTLKQQPWQKLLQYHFKARDVDMATMNNGSKTVEYHEIYFGISNRNATKSSRKPRLVNGLRREVMIE